MLIKDIYGLKYPDEYVIRFFFKENLFQKKGNVIELGCGNGNNLSLFYQYGWDITGVDIDKDFIVEGQKNMQNLCKENALLNKFLFHCDDMVNYVNKYSESYDVLILNGSLYYMEYDKIIELLAQIKNNKLLHPGSLIYFRVRLLNDYRFGKGKKIAQNTFLLTNNDTGEKNCIITFFSEKEFINLISDYFELFELKTMHCMLENYQKEKLISMNSDFIVWGKIK
jgi:SAM-dependent methyltransferase